MHTHTRARAHALMGGQAGRPAARLQVMFALGNLWMVRKTLLQGAQG